MHSALWRACRDTETQAKQGVEWFDSVATQGLNADRGGYVGWVVEGLMPFVGLLWGVCASCVKLLRSTFYSINHLQSFR